MRQPTGADLEPLVEELRRAWGIEFGRAAAVMRALAADP
jgi:hypothetical protein